MMRETKSTYMSSDELVTDFPEEFEQELMNLDVFPVHEPSFELLTETRQKMIQVANLQQYEQQQVKLKRQEDTPQEDRLLDNLVPISLILGAVLTIALGILSYKVLEVSLLKKMIIYMTVIFSAESLLLSGIIRWKQKQVAQRSREK